jgi:hypothetical protein
MYRRLVSLILLPSFLLTQWVGIGRCHDCRAGNGHDDLPHVHLSGRTSPAADSHDCDGSGDESDDTDRFCPHDEEADSHEHDALYLPLPLLLGWHNGRPVHAGIDQAPCPAVLAPVAATLSMMRQAVCLCHPPPLPSGPDCPTYLRTQTLLI